MPPRPRAPCQICKSNDSKYSCSKCSILYCSVPCYKKHKDLAVALNEKSSEEDLPLRPLTSLNWPYIPEESAYPDPLKRDDPKPLQLHQYEAIGGQTILPSYVARLIMICNLPCAATSPDVRKTLATSPRLKELLRSIDTMRGAQREEALQRALGVSVSDARVGDLPGIPTTASDGTVYAEDDRKTLRVLAEAVEAAVRGGKEGVLGLDWGD
ncbi:hypothetical protein EW146_g5491 [Bondarzewia mesenterica]|uniref:HIT-type domain-containing protein n=1 Tax=Bondarzewia mesenterica TaxID=1095465 RepID=A0A4V3XET4_9AGAM|nr:hypothetical protein EW146_g5491 [Bondarzewia mesenterica]